MGNGETTQFGCDVQAQTRKTGEPTASDLQLIYQRGCIGILPPGPGMQPEVEARHAPRTKLSGAKNHSWDILVEYIPEKTRGNKNTHTADPSLSAAAPPSCTGRQNRCKLKQMKGKTPSIPLVHRQQFKDV